MFTKKLSPSKNSLFETIGKWIQYLQMSAEAISRPLVDYNKAWTYKKTPCATLTECPSTIFWRNENLGFQAVLRNPIYHLKTIILNSTNWKDERYRQIKLPNRHVLREERTQT